VADTPDDDRPGRDDLILSINRSVQMLSLFTARRTTLSLNEMQELLPWARTTLHRYAMSLRKAGMLFYDDGTARYSLGPRVVQLGTAALSGLTLTQSVGPFLTRLVARTHVTALLTVWDGEAPLVVRENDDTDRLVSLKVREGSHLPAFDSAAGTVFLTFSEQARGGLAADTSGRYRTLESRQAELDQVRTTGVAYSQTLSGLHSIASPVFQQQEIVGAISLLGTMTELPASGRSDETDELRSACRDLTRILGGVRAAALGEDPADDGSRPESEAGHGG
jgi:DNA-binding IclR family transcriptional regulator